MHLAARASDRGAIEERQRQERSRSDHGSRSRSAGQLERARDDGSAGSNAAHLRIRATAPKNAIIKYHRPHKIQRTPPPLPGRAPSSQSSRSCSKRA